MVVEPIVGGGVEEEAAGWGCGVSKGGKGTEAGDCGKDCGVVGGGEGARQVSDVALRSMEKIAGVANGGADLEFVFFPEYNHHLLDLPGIM
jgi:hypothetical protein